MDIIDIMLARAMTPQGKTEAYVAKANKAAQKAAQAEQDAAAAIATVEAAATTIENTQSAASTLLETAQDTLAAVQAAQQAQGAIPTAYSTTGQNTDGYMTQKAVTDALAAKADTSSLNVYVTTTAMETALSSKADSSALAAKADASALEDYASKQYVTNAIAQIPSSSGSANFNFTTDDAGHIIVIDENGNIIAGAVTESALINALLDSNTFSAKNAVGLDMNYAEKTFTRIQEAVGKSMGSDFNSYPMYGGRMKCNVADDGTINAFYGDQTYTEDGTNGQVMIYQPKFYYRRTPYTTTKLSYGESIQHESLMITATAQPGFKLAPIFNGDLDYVLLPAYDGSLQNNKLASIAGATPLNDITVTEAEAYATARGTGWHIMNLAAEATNQMLEIVEFGTMNGQVALEKGITDSLGGNVKGLFITGSTASLGNGTGHAIETQAIVNNETVTYDTNGKRAIIYRGMENPWGHLWQLIGGANVYGDGTMQGGMVYICTDFNYTPTIIGNNYEGVGFVLPYNYKWISTMGIGDTKYDWVFLPAECLSSATSLLPIGDSLWTTNNFNGINVFASGGSYGFEDECGIFYYAADRTMSESSRVNYGAKLLYIPTKNATYTANIAKWQAKMGG